MPILQSSRGPASGFVDVNFNVTNRRAPSSGDPRKDAPQIGMGAHWQVSEKAAETSSIGVTRRRRNTAFLHALRHHFASQPFERGNVNVRRACPGCSDGRSCRRKTPSIRPPARRWRWSTRRCYAKATQRPSKKCLPSHRRLGSALSAVSEAGLWQTIAGREAPVQGRTSNVVDACQGRAGYAKVCSLLGIFLVKNLHFLSR